MLQDSRERQKLIDDVIALLNETPALEPIAEEVRDLIRMTGSTGLDSARRVEGLQALIYLHNPYDDVYDFYGDFGFKDDISVIREAHQKLCGPPEMTGKRGVNT